jgi:protein-S-isoprenylcysteine O-methyltransferase Ste14
MEYGTSIFLIAVGAVLKFAVTTTVSGISLQTVGVILMLVGLLGLLLSFFWLASVRGRRDVVASPADRVVVSERDRPLL